MNSGFITQMKDKNGDSWYHQIVVETQQEEIQRLQNIIKEIEKYVERMSYAPVVNNPKKDLVKILKRVDKE